MQKNEVFGSCVLSQKTTHPFRMVTDAAAETAC